MSKLLSNLPIENLTPENDYLGIIEKGDMIKNFLLQNTEEFSEIKMFALYGDWGSGKSTLMKYLQKELEGNCNTYFFEAWEFESDSNLPISLLEDLMDKSLSKSNKVSKEILEAAEDLFFGFAKSIRISIPGVSINGKEIIENLDNKPLSFHKSRKEFKINFQKWENLVLKDDISKFNIVFIDDLDRCEPEHVLNLLSALKLFFTYGKKTIFFCGVDKRAVSQAIRTKYGDVLKSDEYLEKVFDLSFRMPKKQNLRVLANQYLKDETIYKIGKQEGTVSDFVAEFLYSLDVRNPRRVKKTLNKFLLFKMLISSLKSDSPLKSINPKVNDSEIVIFDLFFSVYFIILKEFHPQLFEEIAEKNLRLINYRLALKNVPEKNDQRTLIAEIEKLERYFSNNGFNYSKSKLLNDFSNLRKNKKDLTANTIINFTPLNPSELYCNSFQGPLEFHEGFKISKKNIDYRFSSHLLINLEHIINQEAHSSVRISDIYQMVDNIL